jgi:rare lipoprotein A
MNLRLGLLALLLFCIPLAAYSETMVSSHYRSAAPHIAAHRSLPIGTRLKVTNPRTGRSAYVVIRDRGPFIRGRALDISSAVASQLGFGKSGVLPLTTQVIRN